MLECLVFVGTCYLVWGKKDGVWRCGGEEVAPAWWKRGRERLVEWRESADAAMGGGAE
ncbi:unnamed protein product, partial [Dovyalis caffra]